MCAVHQSDELQERTMQFALRVLKLCRALGQRPGEGWAIRDQLVRCGTAIAANHRAACRSRSRREFVAKLGLVVEEADETVFWLELIGRAELISQQRVQPLKDEAHQLLRIFAAAHNTSRLQISNQNSEIRN
jgi:four helix bundle protein